MPELQERTIAPVPPGRDAEVAAVDETRKGFFAAYAQAMNDAGIYE